MRSRDRVRRAIEFDRPDRVPRQTWLLPIAEIEHGHEAIQRFRHDWPDDIATPGLSIPGVADLRTGDPHAPGTYVDEWGCRFENLQAGVIGEVKVPLLGDWSALEDLRVPEACLEIDVDAVNAICRSDDRFMLCGACPRPFERIQFLRGTENIYLDLAEGSPELKTLIQKVHGLYSRELECWALTEVDGLMFMDDWGSQEALLIDPDMWRQWFKPLYADYVRIAHDAGKKAFMHSDGNIMSLFDDLIEIGVDAVNSQLFCMDIEELGRRYRGRITFWGEIDRQQVLPFGDPAQVRRAVKRVVDNLHDPRGGVIAQCELGAGAKLENVCAVFEAWERLASVS